MNRNHYRLRLPAAERRATTVQAVIELAAVMNPADITTGDIAARMRITQGALFRHFATKDEVWREVVDWVTRRVSARVEEAARMAASPLEALEIVFLAQIEDHARHPGVPRIMFGELQRAEDTPARGMVRKFMERYIKALQGFIEQSRTAGQISPDVEARAAATLFVGLIQGMVLQSLVSGNLGVVRKKARDVFALYLRAVRMTP